MIKRRLDRLEEVMGSGNGCLGCGDGGSGPVEVHKSEGHCPVCEGPCQANIPEHCPDCGRLLHITIEFDKPKGFSEAPWFEDLEE